MRYIMTNMSKFIGSLLGSCLTFSLAFSTAVYAESLTKAPEITGEFEAFVLADGLTSPDGLVLHPDSRELYVAEEDIGRISVIRDGKALPVIDGEITVALDDLPAWALTRTRPRSYWEHNRLRSPEGLAFSDEGHLLVTEDIPGGRLLEFIPDTEGNFSIAKPIPIPWLSKPYAWENVKVGKNGTLYVSGSTAEYGPGLYFGTVLSRDTSGNWWVVDYGPFASFAALGLSKDEDILLVSEEVSGHIVWWDTVQHVEIGAIDEMLPNVESVSVLPDGSILALQESQMKLGDQLKGHDVRAMPGRLLRINPITYEIAPYAEGFEVIETVLVDEKTGKIYVTEDNRGRILELRPNTPFDDSDYLLTRAQYTREVTDGRAPRRWPKFLKSFVEELGVKTEDETPGVEKDAEGRLLKQKGQEFTLEEFADRIPLVAGRLKATPKNVSSSDPIEEIRFLMLYPNIAITGNKYATPSLSLFAAMHKSGEVTRSKMITGLSEASYDIYEGRQTTRENPGALFLPLGNVAVHPMGRDVQMALSFMGVEMFDDYFMQLETGREDKGVLTVNPRADGSPNDTYDLEFVEKDIAGNTERNLIVAGLNRMRVNDYGWYKIGNAPVSSLLSMNSTIPWFNKRTADLAKNVNSRNAAYGNMAGDAGFRSDQLAGAAVSARESYAPQVVSDPEELVRRAAARRQVTPSYANEQMMHAEGGDTRQAEPIKTQRNAEGLEERKAEPDPAERRANDAPEEERAQEQGQEVADAMSLPEAEAQGAWTNIIISRAVELWGSAEF